MYLLDLRTPSPREPEISSAVRDAESDGMWGVFHGYFVIEGSQSGGVEGFRGFEVGDRNGGVCDWHLDGYYVGLEAV